MSTATKKMLITAEEFIEMPDPPDGSKQELVRGEIVTMPPTGFRHGLIQGRIAELLNLYARTSQRGRVTVESGVITERDPDSVRGPDVSFWSTERLPLDQVPVGYPEVAADLCAEVLSPSNTVKQMKDKLQEYFRRGVRMVWIVDPEDRTVSVYRSRKQVTVLEQDETLDGGDVLPGFSCKVAELFA